VFTFAEKEIMKRWSPCRGTWSCHLFYRWK